MREFNFILGFLLLFSACGSKSEPDPIANWGEWCGINAGETQQCNGGPFSCYVDPIDRAKGGNIDGVCFEQCLEKDDCGETLISDFDSYLVEWECINNICVPTCDDFGKGCFETWAGPLYCINNICTPRNPTEK